MDYYLNNTCMCVLMKTINYFKLQLKTFKRALKTIHMFIKYRKDLLEEKIMKYKNNHYMI